MEVTEDNKSDEVQNTNTKRRIVMTNGNGIRGSNSTRFQPIFISKKRITKIFCVLLEEIRSGKLWTKKTIDDGEDSIPTLEKSPFRKRLQKNPYAFVAVPISQKIEDRLRRAFPNIPAFLELFQWRPNYNRTGADFNFKDELAHEWFEIDENLDFSPEIGILKHFLYEQANNIIYLSFLVCSYEFLLSLMWVFEFTHMRRSILLIYLSRLSK